MSDWIRLANGTFINLDRVDCITPTTTGTRIVFSGTEDDQITVSEPADEIILKPKVR
jgi:hypothetical protein